jgi:hypothetical protein
MKIKAELGKKGILTSRRRINRIMRLEGLVSKYTVAQSNPSTFTYYINFSHINGSECGIQFSFI